MRIQIPWKSKKIYIYPNKFGFLFFALFCLSIAVGATYANNLVFLMGFLLISILFVCILLTAKNLRHLDILSLNIESGAPNQFTTARLKINNPTSIEKTNLFISFGRKTKSQQISSIGPNEQIEIQLPFQLPNQRGQYKTERVRVSTDNPFGLFHSWFWFKIEKAYLVHPKAFGPQPLPISKAMDGDEFSGLREYKPGDSLSRVSWKHMAKNNELLIKEFNDTDLKAESLNLNQVHDTDYENRLSQMAAWLIEAENQGSYYSLTIKNKTTPTGSGKEHLSQCLDQLALQEAK